MIAANSAKCESRNYFLRLRIDALHSGYTLSCAVGVDDLDGVLKLVQAVHPLDAMRQGAPNALAIRFGPHARVQKRNKSVIVSASDQSSDALAQRDQHGGHSPVVKKRPALFL